MIKKTTTFLTIVAACFIVLAYFGDATWLPDQQLPYLLDKESVFEDKEIIDRQQVAETEHMRVLVNYRPVAEGAILILPKRSVERLEDLSPQEWAEAQQLIQVYQKIFANVLGKKDYVLIVQNGYYGGQTVPHAHIHMIPRGPESTLMKKIQLWNILLTEQLGMRSSLSDTEMKEEKLRLKWTPE